jgi:hypothetical protein
MAFAFSDRHAFSRSTVSGWASLGLSMLKPSLLLLDAVVDLRKRAI